MRPELSVVIPTHDRRDSVLRLLAALAAGSLGPERFEVIVAADGCRDDTVAALRATPFPFAVRVLEQHPGAGAASARNLGAAAASGELLLFLDDDIEPLPTLLETHLALHRRPGAGPAVVIGAPIPVRGRGDGLQHIAVWSWWEDQLEAMRRPGHRFTYADVFTGVLSLPAALFHEAGRFDATLPESCRDDWELGIRLLARGARPVFTREGGGYHHEMRDHGKLRERKVAEGKADVAIAVRHPELWRSLRLSRPPRRGSAGLLTRLAFAAPPVGRALARLLATLLRPLEWLRFRGAWRNLQAATLHYAYWEGVVAGLGGARGGGARRAWRRLAALGRDAGATRPIARATVDLAHGLDEAELRLDTMRPDSVLVRYGEYTLGVIPALAGAEPLLGRHLRAALAGPLARELMVALALGTAARQAAVAR